MSNGKRHPVAAVSRYSTMGADCFVSQPSTSTWKKITIAIVIQYAGRRSSPVCIHASSSTTTRTTDATAARVYSGMLALPIVRGCGGRRGEPRDDLERQQRADRDHHEERDLLDRHRERHRPPGGVARR